MKLINSITILVLALLVSNCSKKETFTMHGEIGKGLQSIFTLEFAGKNVNGKLFYVHNKSLINVNGKIENKILTLYEYDKRKEISGIFIGTFENSHYIGSWADPKGKQTAAFKYELISKTENNNPETTKEINKKEKEIINQTYADWVQQQVKTGEYWTEKQWERAYAPYKDDWDNLDKFLENCLDALPDTMHEVHYGDINGDKILDAWAYIVPIYCMPGTWQIGVRHLPIFFLSKPDNTYSIIDEPEIIGAEIGTFGSVDTILQNGIIVYEGRDYGDEDARCCPSKTWKVKFKYKDGNFKKM